MSGFNTWWHNEGSGFRPLPGEDTEEFSKRIAQIAWSNGEYVQHKALMQLFTDPENQPTQHGTVTVEYMQREIKAGREACAKYLDDQNTAMTDKLAAEIRARGHP